MGRKRFLFIDHSPTFVFGLLSHFNSILDDISHELAVTFSDGLGYLNKNDYDFVLLDMTLDGIDSNQFFSVLKDKILKPVIIITTSNYACWNSHFMLKNGVKCIIGRNSKREEIVEGCRAILSGSNYFPASFVMDLLQKPFASSNGTQALNQLTNREKSILKLFCEGHKIKEITIRLRLASSTVSTHKKRIMTKLGLANSNSFKQFVSTLNSAEVEL